MKPSTKYLKITINILSMALIFVFCVWVLPKIILYFMPFVIAGIIAMIANPMVRFLEQKLKIVRKAGSAVVIVLVLGVVVLLCYVVIARLVSETIGFFSNAPQIWAKVTKTLSGLQDEWMILFQRMPKGMQEWLTSFGETSADNITRWLSGLGEPVSEMATNVASNLPLIIVGIIMSVLGSYVFVAQREYLENLYRKVVPGRVRNRLGLVMSTMKDAVGGYFKAQLKIMVFVYAVLLLGFVILGVEYALLIALLIAILDFLPFFGTGAAMWPWALVCLIQADYKNAIGLMIVWGLSQLVRQLIQPKMVGDSVGLEPIPTLFALYIGFRVGSAIGMILSVPIAMILINLYRAGVFRNFVYSLQLLFKDISALRVFDKQDLIKEGILTEEAEKPEAAAGQDEAANVEETGNADGTGNPKDTEKQTPREVAGQEDNAPKTGKIRKFWEKKK